MIENAYTWKEFIAVRKYTFICILCSCLGMLLFFRAPAYVSNIGHVERGKEHIVPFTYTPSTLEAFVAESKEVLGLVGNGAENYYGCKLWHDKSLSISSSLAQYLVDLESYTSLWRNFPGVRNIQYHLAKDSNACSMLRLHEDGLSGIFKSGHLSVGQTGMVEPLLPPLRHPGICLGEGDKLLDLSFLVHDFEAMCLKLKQTSRIVFFDLGASLSFHGNRESPALYLMELFQQFGFQFHHIFAFEVTKADPENVFEVVPEEYLTSYHWMNVGVDAKEGAKLNPLRMIADAFNEDDFVIMKLDIDNSQLELSLMKQILKNPLLHRLIDHLYIEHHVHLKELAGSWGSSMEGTVEESLEFFRNLREAGISVHYWV